jgi:hypothetical protein
MSKHLTTGDRHFLASVAPQPQSTVAKLQGVEALAEALATEALAHDAVPDWTDLDRLAEALEEDVPIHPDELDTVRADLRFQIGQIERGEPIDYVTGDGG